MGGIVWPRVDDRNFFMPNNIGASSGERELSAIGCHEAPQARSQDFDDADGWRGAIIRYGIVHDTSIGAICASSKGVYLLILFAKTI
jgi:hypothetical protein